MAELKTQKNNASVKDFISLAATKQQDDCRELVRIMAKITGKRASMWGTNIVGFGSYRYKYASGREGDWPLAGFSPRKTSLSIYIMAGFGKSEKLLQKLGKHKIGKSCLYVNKLADIDLEVLKLLIEKSVAAMQKKYSC
jgi:uncharacterized protein DUF1801